MSAVLETEIDPRFATYRAVPGSLVERLLRYLRDNPKAILSRNDIAKMFGVEHREGIDGSLNMAVAKQVLDKCRNRNEMVAWRLGANPNVLLQPEPDPVVRLPAHAPFGAAEFIRYMHIPILKRTPLDPSRRQVDEVDRWLDLFKIGDSAEFSGHMLENLKRPLEAFQVRTGRRFNVMKTTGDRAGIERVK